MKKETEGDRSQGVYRVIKGFKTLAFRPVEDVN
jgi:hypothetical protein